MKLAKALCKASVIIHGRNANGEPDVCFQKGTEYLFCYDEKKGQLFAYNDVKEVHFLGIDSSYTREHFHMISMGDIALFDIDEFTHHRMTRLYKERHNYSE